MLLLLSRITHRPLTELSSRAIADGIPLKALQPRASEEIVRRARSKIKGCQRLYCPAQGILQIGQAKYVESPRKRKSKSIDTHPISVWTVWKEAEIAEKKRRVDAEQAEKEQKKSIAEELRKQRLEGSRG